MVGRFIAAFALVVGVLAEASPAPSVGSIAKEILPPLLDPSKVRALKGDRPANSRLYKILYWVETARQMGADPGVLVTDAQRVVNYSASAAGRADTKTILWNRRKLEDPGCLTATGLRKLRKGQSPVIMTGEHAGDKVALDHVLPCSLVPELAARFYNLEVVPSRLNASKAARISEREVALAVRWREQGLLSAEGLRAVRAAELAPAK